jgi:N-methylhydantoinase A
MKGPWRIAVDTGGTFTDLAIADADGAVIPVKSPTVPSDPAEGVIGAVHLAAERVGLTFSDLLRGCSQFIHGSTIATNTLLEGKGAKVGLIGTLGFRDTLEIRRGLRANPWDHRTPYPSVLVPRSRRLGVSGRIATDGTVLEPLDRDGVRQTALALRDKGAETIAIALINSFVNPTHEQEAAAIVAECWPGVWISRSSDIAPLMGEYERTSTAVVDAAVAPRIVPYLTDLAERLNQGGLTSRLLLMQSNGGMLTVDQVRSRPVALVLSGPAAGVGALDFFARAHGGDRNMITMEIGGTSCDVILMRDGRVEMTDLIEVANYHVLTPSVDIHTVSAGGGTIAKVDDGGLLVTGPEGAGARPGPACYSRGGDRPTITDAQLVLGRLKPGPYAGGVVSLDLAKAQDAIRARIADPLRMSVENAAAGMIEIMEQHLLHAVEKISTERGHDPGRFMLVAVGGAGPMHGASVGRKLGCRGVYIPRIAGVFCAIGMLNSDVRHDFSRTTMTRLQQGALQGLESTFVALEQSGRDVLTEEGFVPDRHDLRRELDLRHPGQQWPLSIQLPNDAGDQAARAIFEDAYERLYGHRQPESIVEIVTIRVIAIGMAPRLPVISNPPSKPATPPFITRPVAIERGVLPAHINVYQGGDLSPGHRIDGPALVEEATTTIFVGRHDQLHVDGANNFVIEYLDGNEAA